MITNYHRPKSKEEAIQLHSRAGINSGYILGSDWFEGRPDDAVEVIDLQNLASSAIHESEASLELNGLTYLSEITGSPIVRENLRRAIMAEFNENRRNNTSLCGAMLKSDGQSLLNAILLAYDGDVVLFEGGLKEKYENWLINKREVGRRVLSSMAVNQSVEIKYETISKTPKDIPELLLALASWKSGRTRLVIGGVDLSAPQVVFDGTDKNGIKEASKNACSHLFNRTKFPAYFTETSQILLQRLLGF